MMKGIMELKKELRESVKFRKRNFLAMLYDVVLVLVFTLGGAFYLRKLVLKLQEEVMTIDFGSLFTKSQVEEGFNAFAGFYLWMVLTSVGVFLAFIFLYSITRYLIYSDLLKKKFKWKPLLRYFGFNLALVLVESYIFVKILISTQELMNLEFQTPRLTIIIILFLLVFVFVHYNAFLTLNLVRTGKLWRSVLNGFKNFYLIPKFYMVYTFFVLFILILSLFNVLSQGLSIVVLPILLLIFIFYIRKYFTQKWNQIRKDK